eukprot:scaffold40305_cov339-Skeletonema_dohrnii-CCMP3373.AAC.1
MVQTARRFHQSKRLENKVEGNKLRQPNVDPFLIAKKKKKDKSAEKPAERCVPNVQRNENACWLLRLCQNASKDESDETGLSVALGVLNTVNEIKTKKSTQADGDDDDFESYCTQMYMGAFAHLRSRNITFILELTAKTSSLVNDDSLTPE